MVGISSPLEGYPTLIFDGHVSSVKEDGGGGGDYVRNKPTQQHCASTTTVASQSQIRRQRRLSSYSSSSMFLVRVISPSNLLLGLFANLSIIQYIGVIAFTTVPTATTLHPIPMMDHHHLCTSAIHTSTQRSNRKKVFFCPTSTSNTRYCHPRTNYTDCFDNYDDDTTGDTSSYSRTVASKTFNRPSVFSAGRIMNSGAVMITLLIMTAMMMMEPSVANAIADPSTTDIDDGTISSTMIMLFNDVSSTTLSSSSSAAAVTVCEMNDVTISTSVGATIPVINLVLAATSPAISSRVIDSSITACTHYVSMLIIIGSIIFERVTVKPNMTNTEEWTMGLADIGIGMSALGVLVSGYHRLAIEKGIIYYTHQPFFWVKMGIVGYDLGLSLFVTILVIQRTVSLTINDGVILTGPMSTQMAQRIREITGTHLKALCVMPLTATLMSRGVGSGFVDYTSTNVPTVGSVLVVIITIAACIVYSLEAINWDYNNNADDADDATTTIS
jgi:putative membrane protein